MSVTVPGYEPLVAARFIYGRLIQYPALAAKVGTRVYQDVAPQGTAFPHIVFTQIFASDLIVVNGIRIWSNMLWQIEYWARTNDPAVVAEGAALIDAALHRKSGPLTGATYGSGYMLECFRERPLALPPRTEGDVVYRRAGGEYRQRVQAT
jgi:hypothetical protein